MTGIIVLDSWCDVWYRIPQLDLKMILVAIQARTTIGKFGAG